MGYMRHHSMAFSSWDEIKLAAFRDLAYEIAPELVSETMTSPVNGYATFFLAPDGSKEGWSESKAGDKIRESLIKEVKKLDYADGSNSIRYCEFMWSDDEGNSEIISHN